MRRSARKRRCTPFEPARRPLTDVLIVAIRLADRLQHRYDTANFNAGGAFARLDLTVEACQRLIADADGEIRALQRALRPER